MNAQRREPLTRERILDAAVAVVQRHGPAKAGVVDVARLLGVNHAMIYRHFASKEALFAAVTERWLSAIGEALRAVTTDAATADMRLRRWLQTLSAFKRSRMLEDKEMFATYHAIAENSADAIAGHLAQMHALMAQILRDGDAAGIFRVRDVDAAAQTVLGASMRFHHPIVLMRDPAAANPEDLDRLIDLLIAGLRAGAI